MRDWFAPGRSPVMGRQAMIATSHPLSTQAGLKILQDGGTAMDAAVAACAMQCVVEPMSTGIGGDCFFLYYSADSKKLHGFNGSGRSPGRLTPEVFRSKGLDKIPTHDILTVTVPGAVEAWQQGVERFGSLPLSDLLTPAISLAHEGYPVTPVTGAMWAHHSPLLKKNEFARKALLSSGTAPAIGSIHRQPQLGETLKQIATQGPEVFYQGEIAQKMVDYIQKAGGVMEAGDLAGHRGEWVEPISSTYRGSEVFQIPPNTQGLAVLLTLNILENFPLKNTPPLSLESTHLFTEAYKLALAESDAFLADPEHTSVPLKELLDKNFAKKLAQKIDPKKARLHPQPSALSGGGAIHKDTVYITAVDAKGNVASFINSLFWPFGSGHVAGETGVLLQNRGSGFSLAPGHPNQVAPHKRPFHTIIPGMVFKGGKPLLSFGVMGGLYQPMGQCQVLSFWMDGGMDIQEAIDAPRFLPGNGKIRVEKHFPASLRQSLETKGHELTESPLPIGGGQAIHIHPETGVLTGGSDARKDGCALGF